MIWVVGTLRFVIKLRTIDHISFFAFAVVTFRSKISVFRSLVRSLTSYVFSFVFFRVNCQPLPKLVLFPLYCLDFSHLPVLSCHPNCHQSDVFSGSSEHRFAKGSVHLRQGFNICESTFPQLFINCCRKSGQIPLLPISDEPFSPLSFSVGTWIIIRMGRFSDDRLSSGSQLYLS